MRSFSAPAACLAALVSALPATAQDLADLPPEFRDRIEAARADCAGFDNGVLSVDWGAVSRPDLDGDFKPDWALDEYLLSCSTAASLFCGTGGCTTTFKVGDSVMTLLNKGWDLALMNTGPVLLAQIHGSECGGTNLNRCVVALTWDEGRWNRVGGAE
ncbi:hypothetical protein OEZ60_05095 [Defluviimonas sp. WL0024]|uniref:Uncharacterized protein n=2 Tax=Albidovulum TaxID=205889 RepID=A0ABT3J969_9RHOB|nr:MULTISPECIES: hypothetical protein [Defluviimonas]MCU9847375.1 hypothetical protein [Defluviimonas sp. WL0024]MCW3783985.1 hypothetical protein [Defluviimonas salinarum]